MFSFLYPSQLETVILIFVFFTEEMTRLFHALSCSCIFLLHHSAAVVVNVRHETSRGITWWLVGVILIVCCVQSQLIQPSDVEIMVTIGKTGADVKVPVNFQTTASDVVQTVAHSPKPQRK